MEGVSLAAQSAAGITSLAGSTEPSLPVSSLAGDVLANDHSLPCQVWLLSAGPEIKPRQLPGRCRWGPGASHGLGEVRTEEGRREKISSFKDGQHREGNVSMYECTWN